MKYLVELAIIPKEDILDPQGNVVGNTLNKMGYPNERVRVGMYIAYQTEKADEKEVRTEVSNITKVLFSRGIIEFNTQTYRIHSIKKLDDKIVS